MQLGLAALFVTPSPKKMDGKADCAVDDEPYINKRKPSSTTAAKDDSNNGPSPNKTDGNSDQVIDYKPFVDKRKPLSMTAVIGVLSNGPSPKKMDGNANQVVDNKPFVDERKPSSMTTLKVNLHNGEHTLIPVTAKNDSFRCTRMQTVRLERRPTASHGEACGCG